MCDIKQGQEIVGECNECGVWYYVTLTDEEMGAFHRYLRGGLSIQECLPDLKKHEQGFLESGYCPDCQKKHLNNGRTSHVKS